MYIYTCTPVHTGPALWPLRPRRGAAGAGLGLPGEPGQYRILFLPICIYIYMYMYICIYIYIYVYMVECYMVGSTNSYTWFLYPYGRFPKFHRVFLGRDPGTLKSDIVSKNIHN